MTSQQTQSDSQIDAHDVKAMVERIRAVAELLAEADWQAPGAQQSQKTQD